MRAFLTTRPSYICPGVSLSINVTIVAKKRPFGHRTYASPPHEPPAHDHHAIEKVQRREEAPMDADANRISASWWEALPSRYKVVFATSMAFVVCQMDKVNISVAIIPMAQDFGWSPTVAGLVQSSFFYGYLVSQIPGGYFTSSVGGRRSLQLGVGLWSLSTALVPVLAGTIPGLCVTRAAVGLGEGVAPAAATDIVARIIPTAERSRAVSFVFGGLHVGALLGLLIAPPIIERFDWPSVFYLFGGIGLIWCVWWESLMRQIAVQDERVAEKLERRGGGGGGATSSSDDGGVPHIQPSSSPAPHAAGLIDTSQTAIPWRSFLRSPPVRALAFTHFCNNWFHYTMLAWLPTYFVDTLATDLTRAAQVSLLPPVAAIVASAIAGPAADSLISKGVSVELVRKVSQCIAFLGPALCLLAASGLQEDQGVLCVGLLTVSLGLASFSLAGLYCNHADLSPKYAPILLGLTNTSGAVPGIAGVAFTGALYDMTGSWGWALFAPSVLFFLAGSAVFVKYGSSDRQDFDITEMNSPFDFERQIFFWREK